MTGPIIRNKDFLSGLMFIAFGLGFIWIARDYNFGEARRMGPAFFPIVLSGLLALIGIAIAGKALLASGEAVAGFTMRGLLLVLVPTLLFGFLVRNAGLAISVAVLVMISATASHLFRWKPTVLLAAGMAGFCVVLFITALGLPIPILGQWFDR